MSGVFFDLETVVDLVRVMASIAERGHDALNACVRHGNDVLCDDVAHLGVTL